MPDTAPLPVDDLRLQAGIEIHADTQGPEAAAVRAGLAAHRRAVLPELPAAAVARRPLCLVRRDLHGTIRAGLVAELTLDWLLVDKFWVDEALRGQGIGRALLLAAEGEAKRQGALGVHLFTSSFQAPGFYRRLGFSEIGRLDGRPVGHQRLWLAKRF